MLSEAFQTNVVSEALRSPQDQSDNAGTGSADLESIHPSAIPQNHPVAFFNRIYCEGFRPPLLPHEEELRAAPNAEALFDYAKLIEPIELDGAVDFKVLRQGSRVALRERRSYRDQWMSETLDGEFVEALYREVVAASVLRRPLYSRGRTTSSERSYLYLLRGVFPVFAENHARLRLLQIEAEPYVEL